MIHYWPFIGNYNDAISNANLFNGKNDSLILDRFNRTNSSLYLNYGYLQVPNGYYIYGDFTLTTWVKMYTLEPGRRFFRMISSNENTILFSLTLNQGTGPYLFYNGMNYAANISLVIENWQHLAFT